MNPFAIEQDNLSLRVVDAVQASIRNGIYRDYLPGERLLAGELGVSRKIVSKALGILAQKGIVQIVHGKRTRILRSPQPGPRKCTKSVAVLAKNSMSVMSHSVTQYLLTLQMHLNRAGYSMSMHFKQSATSEGPPVHAMRQLVRNVPTDCWVLISGNLRMQRFFQDCGIPTFLIGKPNPGIGLPHFYIDYAPACRHAVGRALAAGHRKIGLLLDASATASHQAMQQAFMEGFNCRLGVGAEPVIIPYGPSRFAIPGFLAKAWRQSAQPPSVLIVAIPSACLMALAFFASVSLKVPSDVSLICLGNDPFMHHWTPGISCYMVDGILHYNQCAKMILTLAKKGTLPDATHFCIPEYVDGGSFGPPPPAHTSD